MRAKRSTILAVPLDVNWKNGADPPGVAEVVRDGSENSNLATVHNRSLCLACSKDC